MKHFCSGYGFGEIDHAYSLSLESGVPVEEIFALRESGLGWGQIKKLVARQAEEARPGEETPEPENDSNGKGNSGNNGNGKNNGNNGSNGKNNKGNKGKGKGKP